MELIADLQLHSKYSRAVSKNMDLSEIVSWARRKGIDLVATGDWMHTLWFREIQSQLEEVSEGIYQLKVESQKSKVAVGPGDQGEVKFLLSAEISSIYTQGGKSHRVHTLVFAPDFAIAERINAELLKRGCNLASDGRPIVGLSARDIAEIAFSVSQRCLVIPAHAWTPWFSLYGSKSGFDSIDDCFGDLAGSIFAVETGLSSDPLMNWRISELQRRAIVSFSDAHSGPKLGREATVFQEKNGMTNDKLQMTNFEYNDIYWAIAERFLGRNEGKLQIASTIEFYPEEGKYHYSGHRNCKVIRGPEDLIKEGNKCNVCKRNLTEGVLYRVQQLCGNLPIESKVKISPSGIKWYTDKKKTHPPYVKIVPLNEIISEAVSSTVFSQKVQEIFKSLCREFGSEIEVLLKVPISEIEEQVGDRVAAGIDKVRKGELEIDPGYDGEYGRVKILKEEVIAKQNLSVKKLPQLDLEF